MLTARLLGSRKKKKLTENAKQEYKELHSRVNSFWDDFDSGDKSAKKTTRLRFRLWPC